MMVKATRERPKKCRGRRPNDTKEFKIKPTNNYRGGPKRDRRPGGLDGRAERACTVGSKGSISSAGPPKTNPNPNPTTAGQRAQLKTSDSSHLPCRRRNGSHDHPPPPIIIIIIWHPRRPRSLASEVSAWLLLRRRRRGGATTPPNGLAGTPRRRWSRRLNWKPCRPKWIMNDLSEPWITNDLPRRNNAWNARSNSPSKRPRRPRR